MTTTQLLILIPLFLVDFICSMVVPIYRNKKEDSIIVFLQFLRIILVWILLIAGIEATNRTRDITKDKCPEYERIENVYIKK